MDESGSLAEFVGIGELAETTTHLLALNLQYTAHHGARERRTDQIEQLVLQQAREYLRTVREGFMLSVRVAPGLPDAELRFLLERVMTDWSKLSRELGLEEFINEEAAVQPVPDEPESNRLERVRHQLLAFGMAVVALGQLPRLPSKQITFPHSYSQPPTYSDIPVPSTPGEMLWRIEELEQMVWRLMSDDLQELVQRRYGPLRRTYGFFESSAWLSRKEAERFGVKKRRPSLAVF
ncbi:MAG TPA: hypothetical protein VNK95_18230 [Caldilineaceae bacterium]|nr:hypothetical protein [Caldilineaceae bacterium]